MERVRKLFVWMLVGALCLGVGANLAFAKGGHGMGGGMGPGAGMGPGGGMGMGKGMGICNPYNPALSPEQKQKLLELRQAYLNEITPIQNQLATKKLELRNLWASPNPDQEKILAKQKEMNTLREQIEEKTTKYRLECNKVISSTTTNP